MEDLNITLSGSGEDHIIRIGEAVKLYDPEKVQITGDINAPVSWVKNRFDLIEAKEARIFKVAQSNVIFNHSECTITLKQCEDDRFGPLIIGQATKNKFLSGLRINTSNGYRREELLEAFRFNGHHFATRENHRNLIQKINNFDAKVNREFKTEHDRTKGISNNMANSTVNSPLTGYVITLSVPVLEGFENQTIELSVEVEDKNGVPLFYLICEDIEGIVEANVNAAFTKAEVVFGEYDIVCIHQR